MNKELLLKSLPLLSLFAMSLVLSPGVAMADRDDRGHSREKYSHGEHRSHGNKPDYRSRGKHHKSHDRYGSVRNHDRSNHHDYAHQKHRHDGRRHGSHTTYIVNDHYYADDYYHRDRRRFMIGLHTDNVDIIFRD